ncbi:DUF3617 domain-containing protein [Erythrobacter insulae]|uniref:DUF3617 domain-containing protein n=1 Tax=Erythrobacter insulae TaxID=2584124 RepID=A0A547PDD1_9SPHN|nr:DUF3617 domain-containing protein [Erythrobacter insulae]TRD12153.1 DUF3617 domain-containing protein [Erythrobacter insulae]
MRIQMVLSAASALALAACGGSGAVDDPNDPAQLEAAFEELAKPEPGQYTTTSELIEFAMPGVPDKDAQMMRGLMEMGATQEQSMCITKDMIDDGYQDYVKQLQGFSDDCEYESFDASGGRLDAVMNCKDPSGGTGTISFNGTIGETQQDMTVKMDMNDATSGQGMQMTLKSTTTRVGDCPG